MPLEKCWIFIIQHISETPALLYLPMACRYLSSKVHDLKGSAASSEPAPVGCSLNDCTWFLSDSGSFKPMLQRAECPPWSGKPTKIHYIRRKQLELLIAELEEKSKKRYVT